MTKNKNTIINQFLKAWTDIDYTNIEYNLSNRQNDKIDYLTESLLNIIDDDTKLDKKYEIQQKINEIIGGHHEYQFAFKETISEMCDKTLNDINNTPDNIQKRSAITKLVIGAIGFGVRLVGDGLMIAGKAIDAATLGIINNIPGLSNNVSEKMVMQNAILPNLRLKDLMQYKFLGPI